MLTSIAILRIRGGRSLLTGLLIPFEYLAGFALNVALIGIIYGLARIIRKIVNIGTIFWILMALNVTITLAIGLGPTG